MLPLTNARGNFVSNLSIRRVMTLAVVCCAVVGSGISVSGAAVASPSCSFDIINASFEEPVVGNAWAGKAQADVPGWVLDSRDPYMEFWGPGMMTASQGNQLIEMQYTQAVVLYQDVATTPGDSIEVTIAHRNRYGGLDHVQVEMGPVGGPFDTVIDMNDDSATWYDHSGTYVVPAGQTITRFRMNPEVSGNSNGSLIDNIRTTCTSGSSSHGLTGSNGGSSSAVASSATTPQLTNTGLNEEPLLWVGSAFSFAGIWVLTRGIRAKRRAGRQTYR